VQRPGLYDLQGPRSLLEVLNLAGGLGADAAMRVQITRRTRSGLRTHYVDLERVMQDGDMRFNVPVRPGDVIYVPRADGEVVGRRANGPEGVASHERAS
jgi:polysaccharide export outer membrane protein